MTYSMIDVAATIMMTGREELQHYGNTIWRAVLRALSAYQMYRQYVRRRVTGEDVVGFLLLDRDFPRSVMHCVMQMDFAAGALPRAAATQRHLADLQARLTALDPQALDYVSVHRLVDELQLEFAAVNVAVFETWLNPVRSA